MIDVPVRSLHRVLFVLLATASRASADDHVALGYLASPPIAESGSGVAHAVAGRWDRMISPVIELGIGIEVGASGGDEPITRLAVLPGGAILITRYRAITVRIEEQFGWQIARGRLTLGGLPLRGTEPRGFHEEVAFAIDVEVNPTVALRGRVGAVVDGIFPAGHSSIELGAFVGISAVVTP
jgi:hypothetical protein